MSALIFFTLNTKYRQGFHKSQHLGLNLNAEIRHPEKKEDFLYEN